MEVGTMIFRTLFVYFFILLLLRVFHKRELGNIVLPDLLLIIMVAQLAIPSITNTDIPLLTILIPIIVLFCARLLLILTNNIWQRVTFFIHQGQKRMTDQFPILLIKNGELQVDNLKRIGKNIFWLKAELKRRTGISTFKQISFCRLHADGFWHIDIKDQQSHKR